MSSNTVVVPLSDAAERHLKLGLMEVTEAGRDLAGALLMPQSEHRMSKIGVAAEQTGRAFDRLRGNVLGQTGPVSTFGYLNHRGEIAVRRVIVRGLRWGTTQWYQTPGWLLLGWDVDRAETREFSLANLTLLKTPEQHTPMLHEGAESASLPAPEEKA